MNCYTTVYMCQSGKGMTRGKALYSKPARLHFKTLKASDQANRWWSGVVKRTVSGLGLQGVLLVSGIFSSERSS